MDQMMRVSQWTSAILACTMFAGCQTGRPWASQPPTSMLLERMETGGAAQTGMVTTTGGLASSSTSTLNSTTTPQSEPNARVPIRTGGGSSNGPASQVRTGGSLTVDLRRFLEGFPRPAQRRLLATVQDIDRIVIKLEQDGQTTQTITLTQSDIANDRVSHTFNGLPDGNVIVSVVAYDAQGRPIGSASQVVMVSQSGASAADMTVQLVPDSPSSGPGGTLGASINFVPPPPPPSGTVLKAIEASPFSLAPGPNGTIFMGSVTPAPPNPTAWVSNFLYRLGDDGTVLSTYQMSRRNYTNGIYLRFVPSTGNMWTADLGGGYVKPDGTLVKQYYETRGGITVDALGDAVYADMRTGVIYKMASDGTLTDQGITGYSALDYDRDGMLWANWVNGSIGAGSQPETTVKKYGPLGVELGRYDMGEPVRQIEAAPSGDMWIGTYAPAIAPDVHTSTKLHRVALDGTIRQSISLKYRDLEFDASGNAWVVGDVLTKLSPDGVVLATYPIPGRCVTVDQAGFVWVGASDRLSKIQP